LYKNVVITLASRDRLSEKVEPNWRALALGVSEPFGDFPRLDAVPDELRAVVRVAERAAGVQAARSPRARRRATVLPPAKMLRDGEFTLKEMEDSLGGYSLVHIASHFKFRPGDLTQSYLLLGGGPARELTLFEVKNNSRLKFDGVELLTLSACDTATGVGADGSEVESFGALAQQRGAKAVMATLWPVADASTRIFMEQFYGSWAATRGRSKAEAMRTAQMALLRGEVRPSAVDLKRRDVSSAATNSRPHWKPYTQSEAAPFSHPYFWAPFILIGNWR
ncbi:MAG TPA: CHAT domain-containing protein, partial [Pyrinomonadaceae bacterium]|nr:CHAT domain-containing protein [Pyrinomonadaceae bacterium]